jgi:hypothetical protein
MSTINFDEPSTGNVNADNKTALAIKSSGINGVGMSCESTNDNGAEGIIGKSKNSTGLYGESTNADGVMGKSTNGIGVSAIGGPIGMQAQCVESGGFGIHAEALNGIGVNAIGKSFGVRAIVHAAETGIGIDGASTGAQGIGVSGRSGSWFGVRGISDKKDGVRGESHSEHGSGVAGFNDRGGPGIFGQGNPAGRFVGNVEVRGEVTVTHDIKLIGADCAEEFDICEPTEVEPGTVMVLSKDGKLVQSSNAYDKKVAGVISGGSNYKPGIVLDKKISQTQRAPIALLGKVYCRVDARHSSIEIGDLLTTSTIKGYAMKAEDPMRAFGAIIGKALGSIKEGMGMIPVLVTLQ